MVEMIEGKTKEETIRLTAQFLGISQIEAAFIWGQEHGEIKGDVIVVKEDKNARSDNRQH
jgi:hypothetical protein